MKFFSKTLLALSALTSVTASAGVYTDDLSRCLVEQTSAEDKVNLVRWMFVAAAQHPAVQSIASVTDADLDEANQTTANMFTSLLTERCKETAAKAIKYEGEVTIQASFQVLGQVAAGEMFSHPNVAAGVAGLDAYVDAEKLKSVLQAQPE